MIRVQPKFESDFLERRVPDDPRLAELKDWCAVFHERGLAPLHEHGSFGNLSFRAAPGTDEFFITASGLKLKKDLDNDSFVKVTGVNLERQIVQAEGSRHPSSESMLHYAIYRRRPEINAVFHGHSPVILASGDKLKLPATLAVSPYGSAELVNDVMVALEQHDFLIMRGHGFLALGRTMAEAGAQSLAVLAAAVQ